MKEHYIAVPTIVHVWALEKKTEEGWWMRWHQTYREEDIPTWWNELIDSKPEEYRGRHYIIEG